MSFWHRLKENSDTADPAVDRAVMRVASALASSRWTTAILLVGLIGVVALHFVMF